MVGLRDCEVEWVFDKGRLYGRDGPPQHLAFIISAAYRSAPRPNAELTGDRGGGAAPLLPGHGRRPRHPHARPARDGRDLLLRSRRPRPSAPARRRPSAGSFLAGDWTDTGLPATIEGAVRSGREAARRLDARDRAGPVFPVARWIGLAWLAVWIPAYWSFYGPVVFLNLCDIAVILTCVGLWRGSALLLSSQAVSSLVVDLAWILDLAWRGDHRPPSHRRHRVHVGPRVPGLAARPVPVPRRASGRARLVAAARGLRPARALAADRPSRPWCWSRRGRSGRRRTRTSRSPTRCFGRSWGPAPVHLAVILGGPRRRVRADPPRPAADPPAAGRRLTGRHGDPIFARVNAARRTWCCSTARVTPGAPGPAFTASF